MIRAALILALFASPANAASFVDRAHCWAYPHHERCRPVPMPAPRPAEPVQAPYVAPPPAPVYVPPAPQPSPPPLQAPLPSMPPPVFTAPPPPVAVPPRVRPPVKAKPRVKTKAVPAKVKVKRQRVAMPSWWDCGKARARVAGKSRSEIATLQAWGRTFGYTLTAEQEREAKACLGFS